MAGQIHTIIIIAAICELYWEEEEIVKSVEVQFAIFRQGGYGGHDFADPNNFGSHQDEIGYTVHDSGFIHRPFADQHANNLVEMNPTGGSQEGSINSGYSTPSSNQRRIIREIIV